MTRRDLTDSDTDLKAVDNTPSVDRVELLINKGITKHEDRCPMPDKVDGLQKELAAFREDFKEFRSEMRGQIRQAIFVIPIAITILFAAVGATWALAGSIHVPGKAAAAPVERK